MRKKLSSQEIVSQYIETGIILTETSQNGEYKKGNAIAKKNRRYFEFLESDHLLAETVLWQIMMCDVDKARSIAAADALRLNILIDQAVIVLAEISERNDIIGFGAGMALKIWRGEVPGKTL